MDRGPKRRMFTAALPARRYQVNQATTSSRRGEREERPPRHVFPSFPPREEGGPEGRMEGRAVKGHRIARPSLAPKSVTVSEVET